MSKQGKVAQFLRIEETKNHTKIVYKNANKMPSKFIISYNSPDDFDYIYVRMYLDKFLDRNKLKRFKSKTVDKVTFGKTISKVWFKK